MVNKNDDFLIFLVVLADMSVAKENTICFGKCQVKVVAS